MNNLNLLVKSQCLDFKRGTDRCPSHQNALIVQESLAHDHHPLNPRHQHLPR